MTYRNLRDKLNSIDESLLDLEIQAYDNFTGDFHEFACEFEYNDVPSDIRETYEEDAGLIFIELPKK